MSENKPISQNKANQMYERIQRVINDNKKSCMDLAEVCHDSYVTTTIVDGEAMCVYHAWGYEDWASFVRTELGTYRATANDLRKIWRIFGIELAGCFSVGEIVSISKMRILIAADLNKRNVSKWLRKAKKLNILDLRREVFGDDRVHSWATTLSASELKIVKAAIKTYRDEVDEGATRSQVLTLAMKNLKEIHEKKKTGKKSKKERTPACQLTFRCDHTRSCQHKTCYARCIF